METKTEQAEEEIKEIIFRFLDKDEYKVFIFGSRANEQARKYSDYDIGISGSKPLPETTKFMIEEALEKSDLPYKIDIVDFSLVSPEFKKVALKKIKELK